MSAMLLSIQDLKVAFRLGERGATTLAQAVKGVSFDIAENSTLALVGESGSGKSVTAMAILNLLPDNAQLQRAWNSRRKALPAEPGMPEPRHLPSAFSHEPSGVQRAISAIVAAAKRTPHA